MPTVPQKLVRLAHARPELWSDVRKVLAATTPLPDKFPATEIGLLTWKQFLALRNPEDKHHESGSFDWTVEEMNRTLHQIAVTRSQGKSYSLSTPYGGGSGYVVEQEGLPIAVLHKGTLYFKFGLKPEKIPMQYTDIVLDYKTAKPVKYLADFIPLVSNMAAIARAGYPYLVQNIVVKGEHMQVRAAKAPETDKGTALAILNAEGKIVARGEDEWGATLLAVAREYRSKGLGQVIGKFWYEFNPGYPSGGFTVAGEANALKLWESRVHEFAERGWYSELVRAGRLTKERVMDILSGLTKPIKPLLKDLGEKPVVPSKGETLVYADYPSFIVYDSRFLTDQDDQYIHGHGLFRDSPHVKGVFLYAIDYDSGYQKATTSVAMQMAKDEGEPVYIGKGYTDAVELEGVPNVVIEGDLAHLTDDVLPLALMGRKEALMRKRVDKYGEIGVLLMEQAEAKWG